MRRSGTRKTNMEWQEICDHPQLRDPPSIELLSPSSSGAEMDEKKALYFARGAREFWSCARDGTIRFVDNRQELSHSDLIPGFPGMIEIDFA